MKPEREVEIKLWDWLKTNGIEEVYFNSKNEVGAPVFKVKGLQKKPDLIIKTKDDWGEKYCVVEVKDNSKSLNVLKADKIIHIYFKNYIEKKTKYFIEEKEIKIDYFVIATQSSMKGYLFNHETLIPNFKDLGGSKYEASHTYKTIPSWEGNRTFDFIRILWSFYNSLKHNYEEKVGLGVLIGNSEDNFSPHLMISHYYSKKNKWSQRWWKI